MSGIDLSALNQAQRTIATTLDSPLFVEAGAGSGKTFTLTRRVAWALSPGSGPDGRPFLDSLDQVLVITFTNAAAREIKERVRSTLHAAGMREEALSVDAAWISTIHGMCRRILQRNALDLGLDPSFDICDTHRANELFAQAVEHVVGNARRTARLGTPLARAFDELGYAGVCSRVEALVKAANAAVGGFDGLVLLGGTGDDGIAAAMASLTRAYEALGAQKLTKKAAPMVAQSLEALHAFELLAPGERTAEMARETLESCLRPPYAKSVAELRAEVVAELEHTSLLVALVSLRTLAPVLLELARQTDERYGLIKRSLSLLDNDDLITLALRAVSESPVIAARYMGRFRLVMVDEFQDTDARQLQLISLLAGSATNPRHLATVGDAQQSIYRFRGADVSVFNERGRGIDPEGHVRLDVNYRSHADVLALVDKVCGGTEGILDDFMHLDASATRKDGYRCPSLPRVAIEIVSGQGHGGRATKQEVLELAAQVADRLAWYRDAGEPAGGMALLLGSTTKADLYIDALRARGLECVVTGGSTFTRAPEVKVMLALLRTLANPRDTQSGLFPLLSSEMFELDANDFLVLGSRRQVKLDAPTKRTIDRGLESFDLFGNKEPSARLSHAREVLKCAFASLAAQPVADVCLDVLRNSGWLSRLEAQGAQGQAREANLLAAVRYIRDLTEEMGMGPVRAASEFARWLEASKIAPASLAGPEQDMVRVMTIHASKGLEYPVVAVAECWGNPRPESGVLSGRNERGETLTLLAAPGVKADGVQVDGEPSDLAEWFVELKRRNAEADDQEKARLLYVALTRAREALVLGICAPQSNKGISSRLAAGTVGALFGGVLPEPGETTVDYGGSAPAVVRVSSGEAGQDGQANEDGLATALREVALYPLEDATCDQVEMVRAREDVFSYSSALAQHDGVPSRAQREAEAQGSAYDDDADKATNLGSAFHALAQTMVETGGDHDPARLETLSRTWHLSARQHARLQSAIRLWERSDLRREAQTYALLRAEVPFFSTIDSPYGHYVEGAIDLLCTEGAGIAGHALVVDYKTGDVGLSEEEVRLRHQAQSDLYAQVLLGQGFSSVTCAFICVETGIVARWEY